MTPADLAEDCWALDFEWCSPVWMADADWHVITLGHEWPLLHVVEGICPRCAVPLAGESVRFDAFGETLHTRECPSCHGVWAASGEDGRLRITWMNPWHPAWPAARWTRHPREAQHRESGSRVRLSGQRVSRRWAAHSDDPAAFA